MDGIGLRLDLGLHGWRSFSTLLGYMAILVSVYWTALHLLLSNLSRSRAIRQGKKLQQSEAHNDAVGDVDNE